MLTWEKYIEQTDMEKKLIIVKIKGENIAKKKKTN